MRVTNLYGNHLREILRRTIVVGKISCVVTSDKAETCAQRLLRIQINPISEKKKTIQDSPHVLLGRLSHPNTGSEPETGLQITKQTSSEYTVISI